MEPYGQDDRRWMSEALKLAQKAAAMLETPVGAVVIRDGEIVGCGFNQRESLKDPVAHAELLAIREASRKLNSWRLSGCTLYVTLEPCAMCAGAIVLARMDRLVFGVRDPKGGCAGSIYDLVREPRFNHRLDVTEGVLAEQCGGILTDFFRTLRATRRDGRVVDCARLESE